MTVKTLKSKGKHCTNSSVGSADVTVYLEQYRTAPAPSRDYFGLKVTYTNINIHHWRISHGPIKSPGLRELSFSEYVTNRTAQHDIHRVFGASVAEDILEFARCGGLRLDMLPENVMHLLTRFLGYRDVCRMSQTSKHLYHVLQSDAVWKPIFRTYFKNCATKEELKLARYGGWRAWCKKIKLSMKERQLVDEQRRKTLLKSPRVANKLRTIFPRVDGNPLIGDVMRSPRHMNMKFPILSPREQRNGTIYPMSCMKSGFGQASSLQIAKRFMTTSSMASARRRDSDSSNGNSPRKNKKSKKLLTMYLDLLETKSAPIVVREEDYMKVKRPTKYANYNRVSGMQYRLPIPKTMCHPRTRSTPLPDIIQEREIDEIAANAQRNPHRPFDKHNRHPAQPHRNPPPQEPPSEKPPPNERYMKKFSHEKVMKPFSHEANMKSFKREQTMKPYSHEQNMKPFSHGPNIKPFSPEQNKKPFSTEQNMKQEQTMKPFAHEQNRNPFSHEQKIKPFSPQQNLKPFPLQQNMKQFSHEKNRSTFSREQNMKPFSPEQNLKAFSPEQNLKPLSREQNLKALSPEQNLKPFSPEQNLKPSSPEQNLKAFSPEQSMKPFSPEQSMKPFSSEQNIKPLSKEHTNKPISHEQNMKPFLTEQNGKLSLQEQALKLPLPEQNFKPPSHEPNLKPRSYDQDIRTLPYERSVTARSEIKKKISPPVKEKRVEVKETLPTKKEVTAPKPTQDQKEIKSVEELNVETLYSCSKVFPELADSRLIYRSESPIPIQRSFLGGLSEKWSLNRDKSFLDANELLLIEGRYPASLTQCQILPTFTKTPTKINTNTVEPIDSFGEIRKKLDATLGQDKEIDDFFENYMKNIFSKNILKSETSKRTPSKVVKSFEVMEKNKQDKEIVIDKHGDKTQTKSILKKQSPGSSIAKSSKPEIVVRDDLPKAGKKKEHSYVSDAVYAMAVGDDTEVGILKKSSSQKLEIQKQNLQIQNVNARVNSKRPLRQSKSTPSVFKSCRQGTSQRFITEANLQVVTAEAMRFVPKSKMESLIDFDLKKKQAEICVKSINLRRGKSATNKTACVSKKSPKPRD